jgi:hypothetical protein
MRRWLVVAVVLFVAAGCSDDDNDAAVTTTAAPSSVVTTTTFEATPSTSSGATATSPPTEPREPGDRDELISHFEGPDSPVECNAPTMVEFRWTVQGATSVTLEIDGLNAGSYANGVRTELLPLPCDGEAHKFTLVAVNANGRSTQSKTITSDPT